MSWSVLLESWGREGSASAESDCGVRAAIRSGRFRFLASAEMKARKFRIAFGPAAVALGQGLHGDGDFRRGAEFGQSGAPLWLLCGMAGGGEVRRGRGRERMFLDGERARKSDAGREAPGAREVVARPARPSRWTLPMTALRVASPICCAMTEALSPSFQSFLSVSTRSLVQDMEVLQT